MNLIILNDDELHLSSVRTACEERAVTLKLLKHLLEVERRHLFSKYECSSLHAYCVKYLKMSDPQAGRRVAASRLLNELPVIEEKIATGEMNLTTVCQASSFFKAESRAGNSFAQTEKLELLNELDHQSKEKVERILMAHSSSPEIHVRETVKIKSDELTEIKLVVDQECLAVLIRLKEIWSHAMPGATYTAVVKRLALAEVERHDPDLKAQRAAERKARSNTPREAQREVPTPAESRTSRHIPATVRHAVWLRDLGRCTFVNEATGECCESRRFVECDHIRAFALGVEHTIENLRLRCRAHNQRHAIETYGFKKARHLAMMSRSHVRSARLAYG